ncbi:hypothetical protein [Ahrensia sp. R2A130]|uniref:hypothetical protein n=1 Tax=Ahrensia sp. R2A130 TaxID=744979 RepID=UPI00058DD1B9|nr:hypothetical protein [Ahrensia sp. R2A130]
MDAIELKADGPVQFSMSRSLVLNEPRYSNARAIWHHHANHVSVSQRIEIIDHLVENGGDLVIDEIARTQTDRAQAFAAVLRLVCDTYLTIDLNRPMLGTSRVRLSQLIREDLDHTDVTS